jgi:hypothetical protein
MYWDRRRGGGAAEDELTAAAKDNNSGARLASGKWKRLPASGPRHDCFRQMSGRNRLRLWSPIEPNPGMARITLGQRDSVCMPLIVGVLLWARSR